MTSLQHPGSWWAHPSVQWDRDAFRAAVAQQAARWQDDDKRIQSGWLGWRRRIGSWAGWRGGASRGIRR